VRGAMLPRQTRASAGQRDQWFPDRPLDPISAGALAVLDDIRAALIA